MVLRDIFVNLDICVASKSKENSLGSVPVKKLDKEKGEEIREKWQGYFGLRRSR
jgi:hypothetical protein